MQANVVYKDPRFTYIFTFTDQYMPTTANVSFSGAPVNQYYVYKSANGWNPGVTASNQGLIGFEYSTVTGFEFGDTFQIVSSAGTVNVFNYTPLSALSWNPSSTTITWSGYDGSDDSDVSQFSVIAFSGVTDIYIAASKNLDYINNFTSYQSLTSVSIYENTNTNFTEIDLQNNISLKSLIIDQNNYLTSISLNLCSNLEYLLLTFNLIEGLDLTPNTALTEAEIHSNDNLANIILPSTSSLSAVYFYNNNLSFIDVSVCPTLTIIDLSNNVLTTSAVDTVLIDLDDNGASNGNLNISNNSPRSSASDTAFDSLTAKNWSITL